MWESKLSMVGPRFVLRLSVMVNARETAGLLNPGFHRGKRKLGKDWRVQGRDGWGEAVQDRGEEGARGRHHLTFGPLPQTNGFGAGSEEDSADQDEEFDDEDENNEMEEEERCGISETEGDASDAAEEPLQHTVAREEPLHHVDATRILTDADFKLLARLRAALQEKEKDPRMRSKQAVAHAGPADDEDADADNLPTPSFAVLPESLGAAVKSEKSSKIERIASILSGRKEKKFDHEGHAGGLTNKEKERKKNFVMVRKGKKSIANKIRTSNSDTRYKKMHAKEQFGRERRKRRRT